MSKRLLTLAVSTALVLAAPAVAQAATAPTLGSTSPQARAHLAPCFTNSSSTPDVILQLSDSASTPYIVPAREDGQSITQWSTNTSDDTAGEELTLVVLQPSDSHQYKVVGADAETLPTPLPASNVATFELTTPIKVSTGDTLGLYSTGAGPGPPACFWRAPTTPRGDKLSAYDAPSPPASGQTLSEDNSEGVPISPPRYQLNVAVTLTPPEENAGVSTSAGPSNATAGYPAVLHSVVSNAGPDTVPIKFTDTLPNGLTISSAVAARGSCWVKQRAVTCVIGDLPIGHVAHVTVDVKVHAAGRYTNKVAVTAQGATDPDMTNNTASARLTVRPAATKHCTVPNLTGTSVKVGKHDLKQLGCRVGKIHRTSSREVAAGDIVATSPGPGTYSAGKLVALDVSTGPPTGHKKG